MRPSLITYCGVPLIISGRDEGGDFHRIPITDNGEIVPFKVYSPPTLAEFTSRVVEGGWLR